MKKFLAFLCLALCMIMLACSCGGNDTDTNTDTSTDTDSSTDTNVDTNVDSSEGVDLNDGKYRVFVCNENGEAIVGAFVQYCLDKLCQFGETDANGYLVIPSGEYHVQRVDDLTGTCESVVYEAGSEPHFEGDSKLITIELKLK